jgi:hypothetical protein
MIAIGWRTRCALAGQLAAVALSSGAVTQAGEAETPSWPCVQRKIERLTSAQMWDGPTVEGVTAWRQDNEVSALISMLVSRRVPIAEAAAAIRRFAENQAAERRDEKLKLLFAGILATINDDPPSCWPA